MGGKYRIRAGRYARRRPEALGWKGGGAGTSWKKHLKESLWTSLAASFEQTLFFLRGGFWSFDPVFFSDFFQFFLLFLGILIPFGG